MHSQLTNGRTTIIQPSFSPETFVEDIHKYNSQRPSNNRYKITTLFVVPPILLALLHRVPPEKLKFNPPLKSICCAAAPLPKDLVPALRKLWPTTLIRQGWGMTETATAVTLTTAESPDGFNHTCGAVFPNAEAVIMDPDTLNSIAPGQGQGELWVRAPSVTLGYIDNPKETEAMFNIGGQGWMRSGDEAEFERGKVAANGKIQEAWLLCIRDRLKELIKVCHWCVRLIIGIWESSCSSGIREYTCYTSMCC
jgi:4-coumarate--CoA ligase